MKINLGDLESLAKDAASSASKAISSVIEHEDTKAAIAWTKKTASTATDEAVRLAKVLHEQTIRPEDRPQERHNTMTDNIDRPATDKPSSTGETKECPFCAELILVKAKKCKHCGEFLDGTGKPVGQPTEAATRNDAANRNDAAPETTEYEAHPSMFRNRPFEFLLALALCAVGVGLIILLVWWIRTLGTTLTVTSRRTTLRKGLLSKFTSEVFHKDVRNVQVTQTAMQRLFNVGRVEISSAGQGGFEIAVEGMRDPAKVKQIIDASRRI